MLAQHVKQIAAAGHFDVAVQRFDDEFHAGLLSDCL
jgi:hypothetical protein